MLADTKLKQNWHKTERAKFQLFRFLESRLAAKLEILPHHCKRINQTLFWHLTGPKMQLIGKKKLNGSKVDFSCGWKLEFWLSVSQRRPEFQSCLQILILFTNSIYNIEAALGKLKAGSYLVWEWMIYQFPLPLTAAPRIRWLKELPASMPLKPWP